MAERAILAIDQGTSSTKVLAVDPSMRVIARGSALLVQQTPQAGWVEHLPSDVIDSVRSAIGDCLGQAALDVVGVGISNQRESMLLWDRATGQALSPVLSWQDRRTIDTCARIAGAGHAEFVRAISGLPLDPMFSAVKATWLLDHHDPERTRARAGELCLGTIDSWLLWNLCGEHLIEAGNASRTSLVDLRSGTWSPELLALFDIPVAALPRIVPSLGLLATVRDFAPLPDQIPVAAVLGDSHGALFAHAGWRPGTVKATFGTGSSLMALASDSSADAPGLCRTIAWALPDQPPAIALEANILSAGSTLTWLSEVLDTEPGLLADESALDSDGVALVPAFNGLGAPWWNMQAQAVLTGMTLGTTRAQIARAALDSIPLQVCDVVDELVSAGVRPAGLVADGGITANQPLMQRQADLSGIAVNVSSTAELSALGAAQAAGVALGWWSLSDLEALPREYTVFAPAMPDVERTRLREIWHRALVLSQMQEFRQRRKQVSI